MQTRVALLALTVVVVAACGSRTREGEAPGAVGVADPAPAIAGGSFTLAQANGAQFVVGTGDYMFASTSAGVSAQVALFKQARANYAGPVYLDMGNHECNGYTNSNCPNGDETPNVQAFMG